jgi:hypothetical protein
MDSKLEMLKEVRKKATDVKLQKSLDEKIKILESDKEVKK